MWNKKSAMVNGVPVALVRDSKFIYTTATSKVILFKECVFIWKQSRNYLRNEIAKLKCCELCDLRNRGIKTSQNFAVIRYRAVFV